MPSADLKEIDNLREMFLRDTPLLDVRAPVEFAEGAFPTAANLPLVDDREREQVGIAYKEHGQHRAIELGEELVSGQRRQQRIAAWRGFLEQHPDAVLYCFRGGMRSQISQRWLLEDAGIVCPRVRGGFKAMRRFLLGAIEQDSRACRPVVVGGRTGVGKTRLLADCAPVIDLEALAHHRGSAFGHHAQPQPAQIDFENALAIALLKRVADGNRAFAVEDESRSIGSRHIPPAFFERLSTAPLVLLEAGEEERVEITLQEYVHDALAEFAVEYGPAQGFARWSDYLRGSLDRIRRRLGGDRHAEARRLLEEALSRQAAQAEVDGHRAWIAFLLREYYDGMYEYQISQKRERIVFCGERAAVADYLFSAYGIGRAGGP